MTELQPPAQRHLTIITTHVNADFDALASILAAQKLYPASLIVFPGSQEKNLRDFFISSMAYLFNMADINAIDFTAVKRLVLVDTRQPGRIGKLSVLLDDEDIEVHVYDHHPPAANDIQGDVDVHRLTGATVTLLTELIQQQGIDVTPDEATVMCLGLYEDTGSFTFPSTTEADFRAAAHLVSKGADLNVISSLIAREISPEQIRMLNDMLQASHHYVINGVDIAVTTVTTDRYFPDFAFLVQKLVRMEHLNTIFALARMENKIYIVGRSRESGVDAGDILETFGGGGHPFAASATVKGKTLAQTEQMLLRILEDKVAGRRRAKDLMSSPPIRVPADTSCKDAAGHMTRYNVNALLITDPDAAGENGELLGYITRQVIEKALYHKLDEVPVREYMNTELASVDPEAGIEEIQKKIIDNKQRILPVLDRGHVIGVLTRTDLLNVLVRNAQELEHPAENSSRESIHARTRNILRFMEERLSKRILALLRTIGQSAGEIGLGAYVVGGFVRDLFLYRNNEDIDIVIEGDGIAFAKTFARKVGARIHTHEKFGTAVVIFDDGFKIDVASARMEYYRFPAALPTVEMSSIKMDLFRRDFTINTLSIRLNPERFGTLIDFFLAQRDIKEKVIRVLHNLSFVEDPTRVFRAIRFEQRFGFTIGKLTASLIHNAVTMNFFKEVGGKRVFSELRQILAEESPRDTLGRLNDFELLPFIHPQIHFTPALADLFERVREVLSWYELSFINEPYLRWAVYFAALISPLEEAPSLDICRYFEIAPRLMKLVCDERIEAENRLRWLERRNTWTNSALYRNLATLRTETILYMMALTHTPRVKQAISSYFTQLRLVRISITGKDLQKMGLKPGPMYREILDGIHDGRLNGQLKTKKDELDFAASCISRQSTANRMDEEAPGSN